MSNILQTILLLYEFKSLKFDTKWVIRIATPWIWLDGSDIELMATIGVDEISWQTTFHVDTSAKAFGFNHWPTDSFYVFILEVDTNHIRLTLVFNSSYTNN